MNKIITDNCKLAWFAAAVISYSKKPDAPLAGKIAPLQLPAENVELMNFQGHTITATVLSQHLHGITPTPTPRTAPAT